ncbi:hypothetical protein [Mycobacterium stomatepiae]|uniref:Uncharacterized protein n=1 Tax=Mycobacterium stomatepiae TaxID=470076 RepID=A0A7I7Q2V1_9MYCO|nr:hypothetical protein [Mycobacterium stomatepiae]MCV7165210.1 hypothetical protein [Mycobacterium stomatepiae]BBY20559.1 hypothetical protein MSTO_07640 [Mycobacterium stomatepiae]
MQSIDPRPETVFDYLDPAIDRGATFPELMELLDNYRRFLRERATLEYELNSPFGPPWQAGASPPVA